MRQFIHKDPITTTFHVAGQTIPFIDGVCRLLDPSPIQLARLDGLIKQKLVVERTPKKYKPSKSAAKKKSG